MIEREPFDGLCIGEGDEAFVEYLDHIKSGKDIKGLKNWWIRENGKIYKNEVRPLIMNLDQVPFPDRTFRPPCIISGAWVIASRGCPYKCTFCFNNVYNKIYENYMVRWRTENNVIEEMIEIKDKYCRDGFPLHFIFADDTFNLSSKWLNNFCERYKSEIARPFGCHVRANFVTQEMMKTMKEAGCHGVMMGIETGNERLRNDVLKKALSNKQILRAAKIIKDSGICLATYNMVGLPTGTLDNDMETLRINIDSKIVYADCYVLSPFPGTEIHKIAVNANLLDKNETDYSKFRGGSDLSLKYSPSLKRKTENLQRLFSVVARLPFLYPILPLLIRLPLRRFYVLIYHFYHTLAYTVAVPVPINKIISHYSNLIFFIKF